MRTRWINKLRCKTVKQILLVSSDKEQSHKHTAELKKSLRKHPIESDVQSKRKFVTYTQQIVSYLNGSKGMPPCLYFDIRLWASSSLQISSWSVWSSLKICTEWKQKLQKIWEADGILSDRWCSSQLRERQSKAERVLSKSRQQWPRDEGNGRPRDEGHGRQGRQLRRRDHGCLLKEIPTLPVVLPSSGASKTPQGKKDGFLSKGHLIWAC